MIEIATCSFNTPELTSAAVRSALHFTPEAHVTVFDNSDREPFVCDDSRVMVIDNTRGQIVDFDAMLRACPRKLPNANEWGSAKHCRSVDCLFDILRGGFILMDSDVIIKHDLSPLWNEKKAFVGTIKKFIHRGCYPVWRLLPMLCYFNVPLLRKNHVRYFDRYRCYKLTDVVPYRWYEPGASFLEDAQRLPYEEIQIDGYMVHYGGGSWKSKKKSPEEWIKENFFI